MYGIIPAINPFFISNVSSLHLCCAIMPRVLDSGGPRCVLMKVCLVEVVGRVCRFPAWNCRHRVDGRNQLYQANSTEIAFMSINRKPAETTILSAIILAVVFALPAFAEEAPSNSEPMPTEQTDQSSAAAPLPDQAESEYDYWGCVEDCEFQASNNCAPHTDQADCSEQDKANFLAACKIGCSWAKDHCPK